MSSLNHDDFAHLKIPLEYVLSATNNFSDENVIGTSRFVNCYKGHLLWSGDLIYIDAQRNVVSFVGFCDENGEKIIINKLEMGGNLEMYLSDPRLTWRYTWNIDSDTILLNDSWEPKLSYFRLSMKIEASHERHHSFHVDIYSFGIVMFKLLFGKKLSSIYDDKYLASVAIILYRATETHKMIDCDLREQMNSESFDIFTETAYDCVNEEGSQRPNIDEIVMRLEKALEKEGLW
ncbi:kinase-like domain, phloem protein 2-like protein [Tanacetum coccineum]